MVYLPPVLVKLGVISASPGAVIRSGMMTMFEFSYLYVRIVVRSNTGPRRAIRRGGGSEAPACMSCPGG